ncbi:Disease resistance protein (CC-NBS-LRR class) family [Euphorbia peplus]|nr:Disease resistance protein (CC-NBS-LRR class) family [Euphorbia peplus]
MQASFNNLKSLYTLDLRDSNPSILSVPDPDALSELENLRHFLADGKGIVVVPLKSLRNLETLKCVTARSLTRHNADSQLTNVRTLAVYFKNGKEAEAVLKSPCVVSGLVRSLNMEIYPGTSFPNLEQLSSCEDLTKAVLKGKMSDDWLKFLPASPVKLILCKSELKNDPMIILEKLHNLRYLSLEEDSYIGSEMVCSSDGFCKLEPLKLKSLLQLKEWRLESGGMPCLNTLSLESLERLRRAPWGLTSVSTREEFVVANVKMTDEFKLDAARTFRKAFKREM